MLKSIRRTIAILLVISLIYANISGTIFGVISYAIDDGKEVDIEVNTNEPIVEEEEKKVLTVEVEELYKNNMQEQKTEYKEKLNIEIDAEKEFKEIVISDITSNISDRTVEGNKDVDKTNEVEEKAEIAVEKETNIFYKSTQINKEELIKAIGENGTLEITSKPIEILKEQDSEATDKEEIDAEKIIAIETPTDETEQIQEDNTELENADEEKIEKGIINVENNYVTINSETEADEEGIITIIYPENVNSIEIKVLTDVNKIEKLEIVNTKIIDIVENINTANLLQTTKQILVKDEEKILNEQETIDTTINYTSTKAELGIDKPELSNLVNNKVNFTITMLTSNLQYDLYKNPYFIIELPNFIENVSVDNILILNNPCFEIKQIEQATLQNGNKVIVVTLEGEQLEYTKSNEENVQMVIETTLVSNELMPTIDTEIFLHYYNEKAKTYDGIGTQVLGDAVSKVTFVSDKEIITETKTTVGEKTVTSFNEEYNSIVIEANTYNTAIIDATVVNNMGEAIQNAKILGTTNAMGPIEGIENVYYTANENATVDINDANNGWTSEYTQSAKKYLIVIENFEQAQKFTFSYTMYMPEKVEDDAEYQEKYEIYNTNNEVIKTSQITIYQEAERFDYYEDELIKANIIIKNLEKVEVGDKVEHVVNIANNTDKSLENVRVEINLPKTLGDIQKWTKVNGKYVNAYLIERDNKLILTNIDINSNEIVTIEIEGMLKEYESLNESVKVSIEYEQRKAELSNKIEIVKPSQIETTITSNKLGQTLKAGETIEYIVSLKNNGEAHTNISLNISEMPGMYIQKIEETNTTTGKVASRTAAELTRNIDGIEINPGEIEQILVQCMVKKLNRDTTNTMYVDIVAEDIENVSTERLVNNIAKAEQIEEKDEINVEQEKISTEEKKNENNIISGIAWVDKNENGKKDKNEVVLKGVQAVLINTGTSQEIKKTTTNNEGEYTFENIESGTYIVTFNYNTDKFAITEYKNEEVSDKLNSDVINTTQDEQTIAKTEVISLQAGKKENVNIGLVLSKKFDISINKEITKVTINNGQGISSYDFENTNMAKVEIDGEYLKGSLILVEYQITVTNVGEIAGYVKTISDMIPEGMKFNSELNPEWYQENNEELYSKSLADKELQPGETATITLTLTKEMTDDKILAPVNKVIIQEAFNNHLVKDISTENDEAEATIIISLTTGKTQSYMWLVITVIAIIGLGAFGVIKITNKDSNKNAVNERRK